MCVAISMEPGTMLSLDEVIKMGNANGDGVGFAWAENGAVHWYKTTQYSPDFILNQINKRIGYFRLVHFRLATVGGTRADLCHPFEVGPMANANASGSGSRVLIHNGHWNRWDDIFDIYKKEGALPDYSPWSDSRLMALLANENVEWLDTVGGRVALMDGEGNIQFWGDWQALRDGIKVSNKIWENHNYNYRKHGRGANRYWQGTPWGMSTEEWEEWARYTDDQRQEKEKGSDGKKQEEKATGKAADIQEETFKGVLSQPANGSVSSAGSPARGGGNRVPDGEREGRKLLHSGNGNTNSTGNGHGNANVSERVDLTPWQNPATKKWYAVNPKTIGTRGGTGVMEISAEEASRLMVKTAPSAVQEGDADRHQGKGAGEDGA